MLRSILAAVVVLSGAPAFAHDQPTPNPYSALPVHPGVYGCYDADNNFMLAIGLVDADTYRDDRGDEGAYSYDPGLGILTITTGSFAGSQFWRELERNFRVVHSDGYLTRIGCGIHEDKDIDNPPW